MRLYTSPSSFESVPDNPLHPKCRAALPASGRLAILPKRAHNLTGSVRRADRRAVLFGRLCLLSARVAGQSDGSTQPSAADSRRCVRPRVTPWPARLAHLRTDRFRLGPQPPDRGSRIQSVWRPPARISNACSVLRQRHGGNSATTARHRAGLLLTAGLGAARRIADRRRLDV